MLDVLEFYTDRQKREMEEMDFANTLGARSGGGASGYAGSLSPYPETASAPRFNAGTGLGGAKVSLDGRPGIKRQDSSTSSGINGVDANGAPLSSSAALARAAELVNGSHAAQLQANTMSSGSPARGPLPGSLQPSRPAPPRPLLTANRPAPPAPHGALPKPPLPEHTPSSADLLLRAKAQGPPKESSTKPPGLVDDRVPQRNDSLGGERRLPERPNIGPAKSSPATSKPITDPVSGPAGSTVGPPPVKPLQPAKKPSAPMVTVTAEKEDGGVAAAAAALEKPKQIEKRISTMNEAQIMEKLRSVVSPDDPKALYSKIRKVGQG